MSEYEDEYQELYEEPTAEEQLTEAFCEDPVGTISRVAKAAAEQRALDAVQALGGQLRGIESKYAGGVAAQSTTMALNRMRDSPGVGRERREVDLRRDRRQSDDR